VKETTPRELSLVTYRVGEMKQRYEVSLVTQIKWYYWFYVLRDEENVMDGVYLPRTRQQANM
jgi:hypothetical protein